MKMKGLHKCLQRWWIVSTLISHFLWALCKGTSRISELACFRISSTRSWPLNFALITGRIFWSSLTVCWRLLYFCLTVIHFVPQASESRRPKCDRITPPHLLSWPCCLRFASMYKAIAATRCNPRWLDKPQVRLCD